MRDRESEMVTGDGESHSKRQTSKRQTEGPTSVLCLVLPF